MDHDCISNEELSLVSPITHDTSESPFKSQGEKFLFDGNGVGIEEESEEKFNILPPPSSWPNKEPIKEDGIAEKLKLVCECYLEEKRKERKGYNPMLDLFLRGKISIPDINSLSCELFPSTSPVTPSSSSCTKYNLHFIPAPKETVIRKSFNYLLLDPLVLKKYKNDPFSLSDLEQFKIFVEAIFYVGQGNTNRISHQLKEARKFEEELRKYIIMSEDFDVKEYIEEMKSNKSKWRRLHKLIKIIQIYLNGNGVILQEIFHTATETEAQTREVYLIGAIGRSMLTNINSGKLYLHKDWEKQLTGISLLNRAYQVYNIYSPSEIKRSSIQAEEEIEEEEEEEEED